MPNWPNFDKRGPLFMWNQYSLNSFPYVKLNKFEGSGYLKVSTVFLTRKCFTDKGAKEAKNLRKSRAAMHNSKEFSA